VKLCLDATGPLRNARRTATGGFLVDATLAKVGVLAYDEGGRKVRHLNTSSVLAGALQGVVTAPVTNRHPKKFVDASTYREVVAGHVVGDPQLVDGHVRATLAIQDAELIRDIEAGAAREVSMGYAVDVEEAPGTTEDGEDYDLVRTAIEWNHIAVVPRGRAGGSVRLLLDSEDIPQEEETMKVFKIDGAEVAEDKAQDAFDRALERAAGTLAARDAELESLRSVKAELEQKLADATSAAAVDAAVEAKLRQKADEEAKAAKLEKVKAAYPTLALDGKSDAYIDALFDALSAKDAASEIRQTKAVPKTDAVPVEDARARMLRELTGG